MLQTCGEAKTSGDHVSSCQANVDLWQSAFTLGFDFILLSFFLETPMCKHIYFKDGIDGYTVKLIQLASDVIVCSPCVCVASLHVQQFFPTAQNLACEANWKLSIPHRCVCEGDQLLVSLNVALWWTGNLSLVSPAFTLWQLGVASFNPMTLSKKKILTMDTWRNGGTFTTSRVKYIWWCMGLNCCHT